ncbi:hypothetical protein MSKU3_1011 [Komagataeibacter oboediens]|nr:hypothetical protein MSKU3_1011 [Komagataeibacter oboediens]
MILFLFLMRYFRVGIYVVDLLIFGDEWCLVGAAFEYRSR